MSVSIDELMDYTEEHMMKTVEVMQHDFATIRTGKASPAIVNDLTIDYHGTPTKLKDIAGISTPEARLLVIQPWDPSSVQMIEKAILASDVGISPVSDGKILRLPIPELSEERRANLAKQVKTRSEESKVAIRNIRRDSNDASKKAEKSSDITEDDLKNMLHDIQKLTDNYIAEIDKILKSKEEELMSL